MISVKAPARVFLLLVLLFSIHTTRAQEDTSKPLPTGEVLAGFEEKLAENGHGITRKQPVQIEDAEPVISKMQASYNEFGLQHMERAFLWQYYSSIMIFAIVVCIVITGLFLSYRQFRLQEWKAMNPQKTVTASAEGTSEFTTTTLEFGKEGVKINSAVIGLIILSLSLAFFFLYLKYVYPIQVLSLNSH